MGTAIVVRFYAFSCIIFRLAPAPALYRFGNYHRIPAWEFPGIA